MDRAPRATDHTDRNFAFPWQSLLIIEHEAEKIILSGLSDVPTYKAIRAHGFTSGIIKQCWPPLAIVSAETPSMRGK